MRRQDLKYYVENHTVLRVSDAQREMGVSPPTIYQFIKEEGMERVSKGVYAYPDAWLDEMLLLSLRSDVLIFSHESALLLHHLTDREPPALTVTVPSTYNATHLTKTGVKVFYIKPELMDLGKTESKTPEGNIVPCYDLERTLCDCIRSRTQIDEQVFLGCLKSYVRRSDKRLDRLSTYAEKLGVAGVVSQYMGVLL